MAVKMHIAQAKGGWTAKRHEQKAAGHVQPPISCVAAVATPKQQDYFFFFAFFFFAFFAMSELLC